MQPVAVRGDEAAQQRILFDAETPRRQGRDQQRHADQPQRQFDAGKPVDAPEGGIFVAPVLEDGQRQSDALVRRFGGGPVGLSTLAVAVGEEPETVETVSEPFLVRLGLLLRTPRGRVATPAAWAHAGLTPPPADPVDQQTFDLD